MSHEVLVLNSDYEPLNVCNLRRAVVLLYLGKADILHTNDRQDIPILMTGEGETLPAPSVLRLRYHVKRPLPDLKLSRRSIFARDNYTCQYCGRQCGDLTIDHIIPRSRGGPHTWENLVSACKPCNHRKGGKSLGEARMALRSTPKEPSASVYYTIERRLDSSLTDSWEKFLPGFQPLAHYEPIPA